VLVHPDGASAARTVRGGVIGLILVLLASIALDPHSCRIGYSYDNVGTVWWKQAIALADAALLTGVGVLAWRRRWRAASRVAALDFAFATKVGLVLGHSDLVRLILLDDWRPARVLFWLYLGALLMRAVVVALARVAVEHPAPQGRALDRLPAPG